MNARIMDTHLGFEDHGCFGYVNIAVDFGGSSQGTALIVGQDKLGEFIKRVLLAMDLKYGSWEYLKGMPCRIEKDDKWGGTIRGIGHILCRDEDLFRWDELFQGESE